MQNAPKKVIVLLLLGFPLKVWAAQQAVEEMPSPAPNPGLLQTVPLDAARRTAVKDAMKARDYLRVESLLLEEIERNPKSSQLLTLLGNVFFLDGKYLNSAIAMKKAEALAPLDSRSRFLLAMAYISLEHGDWARPELEKLARSEPRVALYPYWLSRLDYDDMHLTEAVANARKAIHLDPTFMKAYDNLGLYYEALGKTEDAVRAYQEAIRLNRQQRVRSPWPSMNLGALLIKLGRWDEAKASLEESLSEDPRFPQAHFQMGVLLEKEKKCAEAVAELKQAATFDPSFSKPHYVLGRIYHVLGDRKSAESAFAKFQELSQKEKEKAVHRSH